jgi:hypothetical protein
MVPADHPLTYSHMPLVLDWCKGIRWHMSALNKSLSSTYACGGRRGMDCLVISAD